MSDPLDHDVQDFRPRRRRVRIVLLAIGAVIAAFFLITVFTSLYTARLWYRSVGYSSVYSTMFWTRVGLFAGFGLLMAGAVAVSMVIAYRTRPFHRPDSPEQTGLDRYRDAVTPIRTLLLVSVAGVIGLFGGVAANGKWRTFLLWANREPFHVHDPYFHVAHKRGSVRFRSRYRLRRALRRGVTATAGSLRPFRVELRARVSPSAARRLRLPGGRTIVARGRASVAMPGTRRVNLAFTRRARGRLDGARRLTVRVSARVRERGRVTTTRHAFVLAR